MLFRSSYYFDYDNKINVVLEKDFSRDKEIEEYIPVRLKQKNNVFYAKPVNGVHSSFAPYIRSEGLMKIPFGKKTVKKGDTIEVIMLNEL